MGRGLAPLLVFAVLAGCGGDDAQEATPASARPTGQAALTAGVAIVDACLDRTPAGDVERSLDVLLAAYRAAPQRVVGHGDGPYGAVPITLRDHIATMVVDLESADCPAGRAARERLQAELAE